MRTRSVLIALVVTGLCAALPIGLPGEAVGDPPPPIYQDTSYSFAERAADLVARMTPQQRATQLTSSQAPAIAQPRRPHLRLVERGAARRLARVADRGRGNAITLTNTTSYPIDQSIGSSWDPDLMYRVATAISDEAREVVRQNKLDLDFYSPTMNMQHDPRWGRNDEAYGEDPLLVTKIVDQFVNGMEGKDPNGNLLPEAGRLLQDAHDAQALRDEQQRDQPPRRHGRRGRPHDPRVLHRGLPRDRRGHASGLGHELLQPRQRRADRGEPYLIDTLMRQTFGFTGYFTGDCDAIASGIVPQHHWQPPGFPHPLTGVEALAFALGAGEDLECNAGFNGPNTYKGSATAGGTVNAIGMWLTTPNGLHTVNDLDVSAMRLFTARMQLGEFDPDGDVPWVTGPRARARRHVGEQQQQPRRHRDGRPRWRSPARRRTSRSCC